MSETQPGDEAPPAGEVGGGSRRNSAFVASGIFLSRISGLIRERAIAHFFSTGFASDAYTAAFKIPNLLQNLLGEGVLSASFIPVYSRLLAEGRDEEAGRVAGAVVGLLTALAGALVVVGIVFARPLTSVIAPGLTPRTFELTVTLTRIIFPGIGFLVLSAWCLGVLNSHRRFFLSYVAPVLWNGAQIALLVGLGTTIYTGYRGAGVEALSDQTSLAIALGAGTVIGGLLQFGIQLPVVLRITRGLRPTVSTDDPGTRRVLRAFGPVVTGRGVVQLSAYLDTFLASFLAVGALATLRYSQTLYVLPISLFGMSIAAAELPELSRMGLGDRKAVRTRLNAGLTRIAFFVLPTVLGFLVVGDLIVGALYQTGEFGETQVLQVWIVLAGYTLGLLASTSSRLLQSALYGLGDPKTPAVVAAVRVVASAALGAALMLQLDRVSISQAGLQVVGDLPAFSPVDVDLRDADVAESINRLGAAGLSIAAGLMSWLEYGLLHRSLRKRIGTFRLGGHHLGRTLTAAGAAAVVAVVARLVLSGLHPLVSGPVAVLAIGGTYLATAHGLGLSEAENLAQLVRERVRGGPDQPSA